uniref:Coiled-coil domain containing 15 n=1 Tax=Calidris pygmaea TaxID=425635 RepID=A0A8C3J4F5_9CHAR
MRNLAMKMRNLTMEMLMLLSYILFQFCDGSVKVSSLSEPPQRLHTHHQAPLVLWAGVDQEETKKQHQNQYLRNRRLFMNIEREQVKEQLRRRERQKRITEIKSKKEKQRRAEERRMQEAAEQQELPLGEETCRSLAQLKLEERRVRKVEDKPQRNKEQARYIDALRAQMREKIKLYNIDLPPLCSCGSDFWDSHPDTCANNCVFYKNHKGGFVKGRIRPGSFLHEPGPGKQRAKAANVVCFFCCFFFF